MTLSEDRDQKSFVLFRVGDRRMAISAEMLVELAPAVRLHRFPHKSPAVRGVILRRGRIVPVYESRVVLGGKTSYASRYLVVRREVAAGAELSAIPADGECELVTGTALPRATDSPDYVSGRLTVGDESLEVLNFEKLIASYSEEAKS